MRTSLLVLLLLALLAVPAQASTVAYLDGGEVWLASTDGAQRVRLGGPTGDARVWTEVAQADNGRVIGVRREPGKISQLNSFTLWGPDRAIVYQGLLIGQPGWSTYAFPVTLDLTADGRNVVYGYSASRGLYPTMQFDSGTYVLYADRIPAGEPFRIPDWKWPTVAGSRIVAVNGSTVAVQRETGANPFGLDFDGWIDTSLSGLQLERTDVAANATVVAADLTAWNGGTRTQGKIAMIPVTSLGGDLRSGDCFLPAEGVATDASLSQDGTLVAWHDDRGVVVAGVPDFSGAEPCTLTRAAVVISATGKMPSIGPAALPAVVPPAPVAPAGPAGPAPGAGGATGTAPVALTATLTAKLKASALRSGVVVAVTVPAAGTVDAVGTVAGKVVARGSAKAKAAGTVRVRLKATAQARKRLARLKGKTLKLKLTSGGSSTTLTRKLR